MSNNVCAGSPSRSARANASHTPIMEMPRIRLLQIFAACPLPGPPAWITALPIFSRMGRAAAKAVPLPPTMKVSVAASAPATPPDTGASSISNPAAAAAAWTARPMMPSRPRYTSRTCSPAGSIVMTAAAPATSAPRSAAAIAPAATAFATAGAWVSNAHTSWPAATRLRTIGRPMFPNPINPILAMSRPRLLRFCRELEVGPVRRLEIAPDQPFGYARQRRRLPARRLILVDHRRAHAFMEVVHRNHVQGQGEFHAHGRREIAQSGAKTQLTQGYLETRRRFAPKNGYRLVGPRSLLEREPRQDLLDRVAGKAAIDRLTMTSQRRRSRISRHAIEQSGDDDARIARPGRLFQRSFDSRKITTRHGVRRQTAIEHVGGADGGARQSQIGAELAGAARREPAAADIRKEADARLRHGELAALGDDAMRSVHRQPDPAAHDDAIDQRDVGFAAGLDAVIEAILRPIEIPDVRIVSLACIVERSDIAAGAERPPARAADDDRGDIVIPGPRRQPVVERHRHFQRQRVERPRPVECDDGERAVSVEADVHGRSVISRIDSYLTRVLLILSMGARRFEIQLAGALQMQLKRWDEPPSRSCGGFFCSQAH